MNSHPTLSLCGFCCRHTVRVPTPGAPEPTAPTPDDPFEGLVLDADFVRGAQQKESSARARMLASKWKHEPPGDTSFRPAPALGAKRRRGRRVLVVLLAVGLVLALLNAKALYGWAHRQLDSTAGGGATGGPSLVSISL